MQVKATFILLFVKQCEAREKGMTSQNGKCVVEIVRSSSDFRLIIFVKGKF